MAINGIVQYTSGFLPDILLFTWFDGTIIDISTINILLAMYYTAIMFCYDWWLCMVINISVQYKGEILPDIKLLTQGYYVVALYL